MIEIFSYPGDPVPTWEPDLVNETDSLLWDEESGQFFYSYRGKSPTPYSRENAQEDINRYKNEMWYFQKKKAQIAGLSI